jgi:putative ABC transport system permease protein
MSVNLRIHQRTLGNSWTFRLPTNSMRRTILRLLSSLRPGRADADLDREIRSHLQMLEDKYLADGMSPSEARYSAQRAFGGVEQAKEHQRDARMFRWLTGWPMDVKLGVRMLVKYPGLTCIGGLAMAFAIWVGLLVFQVLSLFVHPTLPLPQGDRLMEIRTMDVAANHEEERTLRDMLIWKRSLRSMTDIGAWRDLSRNLVVYAGDAHLVNVAAMSASGFVVSDGVALLGRTLVEADEQPGAPAVAVIGHDVWRTRFGSDPGVLGREVRLGNDYFTIVGVMREGFAFPVAHDVWVPFVTAVMDPQPRSGPAITVFGLLAEGATVQTAQAELTTLGRSAATESPSTHQHLEPRLRPFAMMAAPGGPDDQPMMYSVYLFTAMLLILVCSNVGLLLFARAATREADLLVRMALGATRGRIAAQMFAEALVLGGAAAIVGVFAADLTLRNWGVTFLETNIGRLPFWFDLSLSPEALAVACLLTVATAAVAGIVPALKVTRGMADRLKQSTAGSGGLQFGGIWTVVIVAQVAATVLFPAIVYLENSLLRGVKDFEPGFANERYLAVQLERDWLGEGGASTAKRDERLAATLEEIRQKMAAQPGVVGVTFAEDIPTTNRPQKIIEMGYDVESPTTDAGSTSEQRMREATIAPVHPSYFEVLDAPLLAGRKFTAADAAAGSRVAIVDQGFVDQVLQGRNPVGQQVRFRYPAPGARSWAPASPDVTKPGEWYEIIGVVPELGTGAPTEAGRAAGLYLPATPDLYDLIYMLVQVRSGDPLALVPKVREVAMAVDPSLRLVKMQRANEANNDVLWVMTSWQRITIVVSSVALVLSLAGIYAVLSFTVTRRTREIGVRVTLGASHGRVALAIFRRPVLQVALGIAFGTVLVLVGAWLIQNTELPGSDRELTLREVAMILSYGVFMLGVCLLSCIVPTRRALSVEAAVALRTE